MAYGTASSGIPGALNRIWECSSHDRTVLTVPESLSRSAWKATNHILRIRLIGHFRLAGQASHTMKPLELFFGSSIRFAPYGTAGTPPGSFRSAHNMESGSANSPSETLLMRLVAICVKA